MSLLRFACAPAKRLFFSFQVHNNESDMSRSRSASVDPRRPEERENMTTPVDASLQSNNRHDDERAKSDEHEGADSAQPEIQQPEGYTLSAVYPPQPCERCVRANKTCKGIAGARCEHCKKLKQKCSNYNNAPPRGRHAVAAKASASAISSEKSRPKRKMPASKTQNGEAGSDDESDELDDDQASQPSKKRRLSKASASGGDRKSQLTKALKEIEAQASRVVAAQANAERETKKLQERLAMLATSIQELDDD
ncbi:hypothetical protein AX17_001235 [Amanita inopinata Kibby_2008]|nr:hypothetical protein AX17_001235 [Amanita inopinata Kibby_2008]